MGMNDSYFIISTLFILHNQGRQIDFGTSSQPNLEFSFKLFLSIFTIWIFYNSELRVFLSMFDIKEVIALGSRIMGIINRPSVPAVWIWILPMFKNVQNVPRIKTLMSWIFSNWFTFIINLHKKIFVIVFFHYLLINHQR